MNAPEPMDSPPALTPGQMLAWSQGAATPFPAQATVPEIFAAGADRSPAAPAVREGDLTWSYAELAQTAAQAAALVRAELGEGGGIVGLPSERSRGFVAGILGILQAGGAYLPVDESEPAERRQARLAACRVVLRWESGGERGLSFRLEVPATRAPQSAWAPGPERPAYVLFTSGSTGVPKGVVVPHRAILRLVCGTDYLQMGPAEVVAFHSNPCFDASTLELWGPLLNGGTLVVTPTQTVLSARDLQAHLAAYGITTLWLTMSLLAQLVEEAPALFGSLRHLLFGGEAADAATLRRLCAHGRPAHLLNGYGPTECTTFAVCHKLAGPIAEPIPIGRPIANTTTYVLDAAGELAVEGELYVGGPGLALGYLAPDPAEAANLLAAGVPLSPLTAERFVETRWGRLYRTGDRVRWRADGRLDFFGRLDRQVKIRGFRIEPGEVEAALRQVEGVTRGAVVVSARPSGEPALVAYFTGEASAEAVRQTLAEKLPAQMVPAICRPVETLPLTANGKLDERALPSPWAEGPAPLAGEGSLVEAITAAWREVLGVEAVGLEQNFFELGGTSLSLLRVFRRLTPRTECASLRVVHLFQYPTVRALSQYLQTQAPGWSAHPAKSRAEKARAGLARRRLLSQP